MKQWKESQNRRVEFAITASKKMIEEAKTETRVIHIRFNSIYAVSLKTRCY
jgi:hypothetical protein